DLEKKQSDLDAQYFKVDKDNKDLKAQISADKYDYSEAVKNKEKTASKLKELDKENDETNALNQKLFDLDQKKKEVSKSLAAIYAKRDDLAVKKKKMLADYDALKTKIQNLRPTFSLGNFGPYVLYYFRNLPLVD